MSEITPESLLKQIKKLEGKALPPVHLWDPPLCSNISMKIDREGRWYFMNSPINRKRMICLFSKVIRYDRDGSYYLVTPYEKIKLKVEDKPFYVIDFSIVGKGSEQILSFKTYTEDIFLLDKEHPLKIKVDKNTKQPSPYVLVRNNLEGLISRNIFYKLVDIAKREVIKGSSRWGVWSKGLFFSIE